MTEAFAVDVVVDRTPDQVWEGLTDWSQAHLWMSGVEWVRAEGPTEPGTILTFHARGKDRPAQIAEVEARRCVVVRSEQGGVTADYTYRLDPTDETSTRVSLTADCRTKGMLWGPFSPLLRFLMRRTDQGQMQAFKTMMEGR